MTGLRSYAGHTVASEIELSELPPAPLPHDGADFRIELERNLPALADAQWKYHWCNDAGARLASLAWRADVAVLRFPAAAIVQAHRSGRVAVTPLVGAGEAMLRHVLVDLVLPRLLAKRGHLVVHGGVVTLEDARGVVLAGESGRGKSTLCAALASRGARLLTDDGLLLAPDREAVIATPGYPSLRLWPDSQAALRLSDPTMQATAAYSHKRRIASNLTTSFSTVAVSAVFALQPAAGETAIRIELLSPHEACLELVRNAFQLDPTDMTHAAEMLARSAAIADRVPVFALSYPRDFERLADVVAAIIAALPSN